MSGLPRSRGRRTRTTQAARSPRVHAYGCRMRGRTRPSCRGIRSAGGSVLRHSLHPPFAPGPVVTEDVCQGRGVLAFVGDVVAIHAVTDRGLHGTATRGSEVPRRVVAFAFGSVVVDVTGDEFVDDVPGG